MTQELFYSVFNTAAGWLGVLGSAAGLKRVILPRRSDVEVHRLLGHGAGFSPEMYADLASRFAAYFNGKPADFPDKLDLAAATPFQREVWGAARLISWGETRSYGWLAEKIGRPAAARAVGQALGKNPLPVIIPCHRVLAVNGGLGGFSGGLEMKKYLLHLEKSIGTR